MIIFGVILLIIGFLLKVAIVWTIGIVVLAAGLILALPGGCWPKCRTVVGTTVTRFPVGTGGQ